MKNHLVPFYWCLCFQIQAMFDAIELCAAVCWKGVWGVTVKIQWERFFGLGIRSWRWVGIFGGWLRMWVWTRFWIWGCHHYFNFGLFEILRMSVYGCRVSENCHLHPFTALNFSPYSFFSLSHSFSSSTPLTQSSESWPPLSTATPSNSSVSPTHSSSNLNSPPSIPLQTSNSLHINLTYTSNPTSASVCPHSASPCSSYSPQKHAYPLSPCYPSHSDACSDLH